jgi:hypothetical protein
MWGFFVHATGEIATLFSSHEDAESFRLTNHLESETFPFAQVEEQTGKQANDR